MKNIFTILYTSCALLMAGFCPVSAYSAQSPVGKTSKTASKTSKTTAKTSKTVSGNKTGQVKKAKASADATLECSLRGCVHDGADVVLIFSVENPGGSNLDCLMGPIDIPSLMVVGDNGRVFTDVDCFIGHEKIATSKDTDHPKAFHVNAHDSRLVSMVIHDVPKDVVHFRDVDIPLKIEGESTVLYHFDNISVTSETNAKRLLSDYIPAHSFPQ
ncbi:MAG: hypothetical protein NC328_06770 [Muribaculum sp.]|nr:hypothetical protein [Muribaculum sp.]